MLLQSDLSGMRGDTDSYYDYVRSTRLLQYRAVPLSTPNGAVLFRVVYTQTCPKCGWGWDMRASLCRVGEAERLRTVRK